MNQFAILFENRLPNSSLPTAHLHKLFNTLETGAVSTSTSEFGASIGLAATLTGSGNFLSLSNSGTNPTASTTMETTTIGTRPATGQTYTFMPTATTAASVSISGRLMTGKGGA